MKIVFIRTHSLLNAHFPLMKHTHVYNCTCMYAYLPCGRCSMNSYQDDHTKISIYSYQDDHSKYLYIVIKMIIPKYLYFVSVLYHLARETVGG